MKRLEREDILSKVFYDPKRNYLKVLTHLDAKEFNELADHLRYWIERSRNSNTQKTTSHVDYKHRLFYALKWLSSGESFRSLEFFTGVSKTTLREDL